MQTASNSVNLDILPATQGGNITGEKGPRCRSCSGAGFTNLVTGGSSGCARCNRTGVEPPSPYALEQRIADLEERVKELVRQILEMREGGVS